MITFGLTGGICCGKSTVSRTFQKHGIPLVDADQVARQVVIPGSYGLNRIIELFGAEMLLPNGSLDRAKLAELVFSHPDLDVRKSHMSDLNELMGPLIQQEGASQINKLHAEGHAVVGWDAALLIEAGNAERYQPLVVVYCPREMQLERLMSRNGLTRQQAMDRIESQMSGELKAHMADHVIYTFSSIDDSIKQTELLIEKFQQQENIS